MGLAEGKAALGSNDCIECGAICNPDVMVELFRDLINYFTFGCFVCDVKLVVVFFPLVYS